MRTFALLTLLAALSWTATSASAEPRFIRLSYHQPDTARAIAVSWTSDGVNDPNLVQYGIVAPGQFEVEAEVFQAAGELDAIHVAHLEDLKPGTTYQYRVGGPGAWSEIYEFTTAPDNPCTPLRFVALGDNRPDADWLPQLKWNPILAEALDTGPEFVLHSGDIVKDGEDTKQWRDFLSNSDPFLAAFPLMATIGNHDDGPAAGDGGYYNQIFEYPRNAVTGTEDYYYFTWGNAVFVSLSSQTFGGGEFAFQEQADWLDQVLTENPARWKVVYLHHPPYTSHAKFDLVFTEFEFNHPPNERNTNPALVPVFDKHHVDLVFAGHNHYYERFGPLAQGSSPDEGAPVGSFADGTVYVITGGAGALVYDEFEIPWVEFEVDLVDWVCGKAEGSEVCAGDHHYVVVDIEDEHLHFEAWATAQQTVEANPANAKLIDSFDIYKDPDPVCDAPPVVEPNPEPVVEAPDVEIVTQPEATFEIVSQPDAAADVPALDLPAAGPEAGPETVAPDAPGCGDGGCPAGPEPVESGSPPAASSCGCRIQSAPAGSAGPWLLLTLAALWLLRCRRKRLEAAGESHYI